MRTVSCGSSCRVRPDEDGVAAGPHRVRHLPFRSPLIHFASPVRVAIRPSSVWAYFRTT